MLNKEDPPMRSQSAIRNLVVGFIGAVLAVGVLAAGLHAAELEPVTLPGTGDSTDVLRDLAAAYTTQYPDRKIIVPNSIGSDGGVRVVGTGESPIGRVARKPTPEELAKFGDFKYLEFARVPVAFVVNPKTGVRELSEAQICDIYSGRVTNWKSVGGNDLPIDVQARPEDGSNMRTIRQHMACFTKLEITPDAHPNLRNLDLVASLKTFAGALGFMPLSEAELHGFTVVTVDGVAPSSPQYKFGIALAFVYKAAFSPGMRAFLHYLKTEAAREIMRKTGHVPVER
jgi:phosphate transport system substrate-binding protein